jgi:hypothetical protein
MRIQGRFSHFSQKPYDWRDEAQTIQYACSNLSENDSSIRRNDNRSSGGGLLYLRLGSLDGGGEQMYGG